MNSFIFSEEYSFLEVLDYALFQRIGEHSRFYLRALIPESEKQRCLGSTGHSERIMEHSEEGDQLFFQGVVSAVRVQSRAAVHELFWELSSATVLMDQREHLRVFQDPALRFRELVSRLVRDYSGADVIMPSSAERPISRLYVQYRESDWAFLSRLASELGSWLCPDPASGGCHFFFGIPERGESEEEISEKELLSVSALQECAGFTGAVRLLHCRGRKRYKPGQRLRLGGESYTVFQTSLRLEKGESMQESLLVRTGDLKASRRENRRLSGVLLFAEVSEVSGVTVRLSIEGDESGLRPAAYFPYATVYSGRDGSGWYGMPEPGDRVMLRFPDADERKAYAASAVHLGTAGGRDRPEQKFLRDRNGHELRLYPGGILLRDRGGNFISLSDRDGIEVRSKKGLSLQSGGELSLCSEAENVCVSAAGEISIRQREGSIRLSEEIRADGRRILMS